jgi:nicotinamidase-related amidase
MTTALLVIDMQHGLCAGDGAAFDIARVTDNINALIGRARAANAPVLLVQHEEADGPLRHGSAAWSLSAALAATDGDPRIRKTTANSFFGTDLHAALQARAIKHLVVCGLQTEFCVDTTVRQALPLGYDVTLAADGHSTTDDVISAAQAIAHHNRTLGWLPSYGPRMQVLPTAGIRFAAA